MMEAAAAGYRTATLASIITMFPTAAPFLSAAGES